MIQYADATNELHPIFFLFWSCLDQYLLISIKSLVLLCTRTYYRFSKRITKNGIVVWPPVNVYLCATFQLTCERCPKLERKSCCLWQSCCVSIQLVLEELLPSINMQQYKLLLFEQYKLLLIKQYKLLLINYIYLCDICCHTFTKVLYTVISSLTMPQQLL